MKIWQHVQKILQPWQLPKHANPENETVSEPLSGDLSDNDDALAEVKQSLNALLQDPHVPDTVRRELTPEYEALQTMLDKLEHGHIHIAVFGRVSVGKSSVLNALIGKELFYTSALHGATRKPELGSWRQSDDGHVFLYDTPGINEIDGEERERLAHEVAANSDLVLFVVDGDMTDTEMTALRILSKTNRPILLDLNKADRYTKSEAEVLLEQLRETVKDFIPSENITTSTAAPADRIYIEVDEYGNEREVRRQPPPDVESLREHLWDILEREGKTLMAINAGLFAGRLSDQVATRIIQVKQSVAQRVIMSYCFAKGLAVAFNPIPITDVVAAAGLDIALILHLSRVYGLPVTNREAGNLIRVIMAQMVALMGAVWAVNLLSSALKIGSAGLSTMITASAQGSIAYYGTLVVGRSAEHYFRQGKSWGEGGPKQVVKKILDSIDRASILKQAREDISRRLSRS